MNEPKTMTWQVGLIECGACGFHCSASWATSSALPLWCPNCFRRWAMPIPFMQAGP